MEDAISSRDFPRVLAFIEGGHQQLTLPPFHTAPRSASREELNEARRAWAENVEGTRHAFVQWLRGEEGKAWTSRPLLLDRLLPSPHSEGGLLLTGGPLQKAGSWANPGGVLETVWNVPVMTAILRAAHKVVEDIGEETNFALVRLAIRARNSRGIGRF
uniref:Uncharacterized protein n=1 Tax=Chromera velia CCMP2878 TaxID=1169474 RepID=A0A0G4FDQ4_9ALVE|eukprot:Cvel_16385.t1-p1 / transcript=Cvel_16385.t1 / gene=Cvel_16385 / organism=Chromera_velia_CCMP2878 / gene_product=hypothetical protein / transcript_product=hypothetical protein / location=Cvel_scaffold1260:27427-27900(+) / protein_length=158 / sequence_SO=supercontig / SO=protein_coding / is_pseudo=false